ncbi:SprT-like domain-containing protein [Luteimicrobium sp. DT211]|uniref:SprT-like domain-containing protein n=1 Tax=Luteimicrobium sp. DT211 TaxID=3393412 RepID=UPI003CEC8A7A
MPDVLDQIHAQARAAMDDHGLTDWDLVFDQAVRRAGATRFDRRSISLSAPLMQRYAQEGAHDEIRETVLHEIAHALAGRRHNHDATWQAIARRIGSTGRRTVAPEAPAIEADWVGTCPAGHTMTRHRRPTGIGSCSRCAPRFDERFLLTWTYRGTRLADVGSRVRVTAPGRWNGAVGTVRRVAQTRYHLAVPGADRPLTVRFEHAEPA